MKLLIQPDCIPCILRMGVYAARKLRMKEEEVKELYCRMAEIPSLKGHDWYVTSPEILERVMEIIKSVAGVQDPFSMIKSEQNRRITTMEPLLRNIIKKSSDPLYAAIKLAIIGNSIDLMMADSSVDIESTINERLKIDLSGEVYSNLKEHLGRSGSLLYFGDNSGEIVIDKILIKFIQDQYGPDITYVVRSRPVLNDVTLSEAVSVGMEKIVTVSENGIDGPLPGTILRRCSDEVKNLANKANLIISKGGGNFDTLSEEEDSVRKKVYFLLLSKCFPYNSLFGVGLHQPVLVNIS